MKNIALIGYSLHHGGAEKVMANVSQLLQTVDFEIYTIIVNDGVEYDFGGKLLNLGLLPNATALDRVKKFWTLFQLIKKHNIEYIIDFRARINDWEEIIIANILYFYTKPIFTIHSYQLENYLPKNKFLFKLWTLRNPRIIAVSDAIHQKITKKYQYKNVVTLKNPFDFASIQLKTNENININFKYIIFAGRLSFEKQIPELVKSYAKSILPNQKIKLLIVGEGNEENQIKNTIQECNQEENVILLGKKLNPYPYIKQAEFLVLCSKFEGFPTVLLESLACETPVVSFDCASGPNEIIVNKTNGLLVENQNYDALTNALDIFIEDKILYQFCKSNTLLNLENYSYTNIFNHWNKILK